MTMRDWVWLAGVVLLALLFIFLVARGRDFDREHDRIGPDALAGIAPPLVASGPPSVRCLRALAAVEGAGLSLPEGAEFRCPGNTESRPGGRQHHGVACWRNAYFCPGGSYIAVSPSRIGPSNRLLRHVVAHEACHLLEFEAGGRPQSEAVANACAAKAGFPR